MKIRLVLLAVLAGMFCVTVSGKDAQPLLGGREKLLVLPLDFEFFKQGFGSHETLVEKTEDGRRNLEAAMWRAFRREKVLQTEKMPDLDAAQAATLAEHLVLLKQVVNSIGAEAVSRDRAWRDWERGLIDYSIGPGLGFLAERSGVDSAVFIFGLRMMPTVGVAATGAAAALGGGYAPSSERIMIAVVFDLRSGDIINIFGVDRGLKGEPYEVPGANTWIHALFEPFPEKGVFEPQKKAPKPRKHERYDRKGVSFLPPQGWRRDYALSSPSFARHGLGLERLRFDDVPLKDLNTADQPALGKAVAVKFLVDAGFTTPEVVRSAAATVAGKPGFEVELNSTLRYDPATIRFRHLVHGFASGDKVFLLAYEAPAIYFYERYLPEATGALAEFRMP